MKSQETLPIEFEFEKISEQPITISGPGYFCQKGNDVVFLCQNRNCEKNSFICQNKNCSCRNEHQKCMKTFCKQFFEELNKKIYSTTEIKQKVDEIIDNAIDYLSQLRENIHTDLKYLGLNETEKKFMQTTEVKQFKDISGSDIWTICQSIYDRKEISSSYIIKELNKFWKSSEKMLKKNFEKLQDIAQKQSKIPNVFVGSQILRDPEDIEKLYGFFDTSSFSAKLLYSAKKEKYDMDKYQQVSQGKQNILLLIKSECGKIFGGFIDKQVPYCGFGSGSVVDRSKKAFVFSLTNNDQFIPAYQNFGNVFTVTLSEGPNFGNDFLAIYRNQSPKYVDDNESNERVIRTNPRTGVVGLGGLNPPALGAGFGFGGAFGGGYGGGFGGGFVLQTPQQINQFGAKQAEKTQHYCVVFESVNFFNQNYPYGPDSREKFTGQRKRQFPIKEWEIFQLKFEQSLSN